MTLKSLISERNGKLCSKRVSSLILMIAAIVLAFYRADSAVAIAFLSASVGSNALTIKDPDLNTNSNDTNDGILPARG